MEKKCGEVEAPTSHRHPRQHQQGTAVGVGNKDKIQCSMAVSQETDAELGLEIFKLGSFPKRGGRKSEKEAFYLIFNCLYLWVSQEKDGPGQTVSAADAHPSQRS